MSDEPLPRPPARPPEASATPPDAPEAAAKAAHVPSVPLAAEPPAAPSAPTQDATALDALNDQLALTPEGLALLGLVDPAATAAAGRHADGPGDGNGDRPSHGAQGAAAAAAAANRPAAPQAAAPARPLGPAAAGPDAAAAATPGAPASPAAARAWAARPRIAAVLLTGALGLTALVIARRPRPVAQAPQASASPALPPSLALATPGTPATPKPTDARPPGEGLGGAARPPASPSAAVRTPGPNGPASWPAPQLLPLTAGKVQALDCVSLRAGLRGSSVAPGLAAWAAFRLAWACDDPLAVAVPDVPRRRHVAPDAMLAAAARAGLATLHDAPAGTAPRRQDGAWQRTPQGRLVAALASTQAPAPVRRQALRRLQQARSLGSDGQVLAASLQWAEAPAAATATLAQLVRHGDALALARASHLLLAQEAYLPLLAALQPRAEALTAQALPTLLVQASAVHQRWLVDVALRLAVTQGELVPAFELARLALTLAPHDARAQADVATLAQAVGVARQPGQPAAPPAAAADAAAPPESQPDDRGRTLWRGPWTGDVVTLALDWLVDAAAHAATTEARAPALQALRSWIAARPQDDRPPTRLAELGARLRDGALQLEGREVLALRHPERESERLALALALVEAGQNDRADALLRALAPDVSLQGKPELLYVQARSLAGRDPLQARTLLAAANKLAPSVRNDVLLAELLEAHDQLDEAAAALARAAAASPDDVGLQLRHVDLLLRQGELQAARAGLDALAERRPGDAAVQQTLAQVCQKQGDLPAARTALTLAVAASPAPAPLLLQLGRMQLLEMGQLGDGVRALQRATKLDPSLAEAHYLLGLGLRDLGDDAGMRRSWHQYLQLAPRGAYAAEVRQGLHR